MAYGFSNIPNLTALTFYPIDRQTDGDGSTPPDATWIVSQIDAEAPVLASAAQGEGAGTITKSTDLEVALYTDTLSRFLHGQTNVKGVTYDPNTENYVFDMKIWDSTFPGWALEDDEFRLVPTTTKNVVDLLNTPAATTISLIGAEIAPALGAKHVQLSSSTAGRNGAIQVTGGAANALTLPVQGAATVVTDLVTGNTVSYCRVLVNRTPSLEKGVSQGMFVSIDTPIPARRLPAWDQVLPRATIANGLLSINATSGFWEFAGTEKHPLVGERIRFEKHGRFTALTAVDNPQLFDGLLNGDFVTVLDASGEWFDITQGAPTIGFGAARVTLADGRVLFAGGSSIPTGAQAVTVAYAIYSPVGKSWTTGNMVDARAWSAATRLLDDRLLFAGGISANGTRLATCFLANADGSNWVQTGSLNVARSHHTVTTMSDGRVIAVGGYDANGDPLASAEIFNPNTGTWALSSNLLPYPVADHETIPLSNNRLAVFGAGNKVQVLQSYASMLWDTRAYGYAELSGVVAGDTVTIAGVTFTAVAAGPGAHEFLVGISDEATAGNLATAVATELAGTVTATASVGIVMVEAVDPGVGGNAIAWSQTGNHVTLLPAASLGGGLGNTGRLNTARYCPTCITLPSGKVAVIGGLATSAFDANAIADVEIYDTVSFVSQSVAPLAWARGHGAATLLSDGRVLLVGGVNAEIPNQTVEIYDPTIDRWSWYAGTPTAKVGRAYCVLNEDDTVSSLASAVSLNGHVIATTGAQYLDLTAPGVALSNLGTFQVVAHSLTSIWIENPNSVAEARRANLVLRTAASFMPGDLLRIATSRLGLANRGDFAINAINLNNINVLGAVGLTDCSTTSLRGEAEPLQGIPAQADRKIMRIDRLVPVAGTNLVAIYLDTPHCRDSTQAAQWTEFPVAHISEGARSTLSCLDKLDFDTSQVFGTDAYHHNTGLIAEVNRTLYGDSTDLDTYPALLGVGQKVEIAAALVRRIQLHLGIKMSAGLSFATVKPRVQNAVAQVINLAGPNRIALSDIVAAAKVPGVTSVVILSPAYDAANDNIPVQPYETAKVLDIEDIRVSILQGN